MLAARRARLRSLYPFLMIPRPGAAQAAEEASTQRCEARARLSLHGSPALRLIWLMPQHEQRAVDDTYYAVASEGFSLRVMAGCALRRGHWVDRLWRHLHLEGVHLVLRCGERHGRSGLRGPTGVTAPLTVFVTNERLARVPFFGQFCQLQCTQVAQDKGS